MTEIRDITMISPPKNGRVVAAPLLCWLVVGDDGTVVETIRSFMVELAANGTSPSTRRAYCHDLLRWWRFCEAIDTTWDAATTTDVRDFVRWLKAKPNPQRTRSGAASRPAAGSVNAITGKSYLRDGYAPRTINHALSVLSAFYTFTYEAGLGPWSPVPGSHHDRRHLRVRRARYRQKVPVFQPRAISEENLQDLFATLSRDRDRALVAIALSSGARAGELLSMTVKGLEAGQGVVAVEPKGGLGSRIWIPAAPESFVWTARYLATRPATTTDEPLWLTLRPPHTPMDYFALRQVLERANRRLGTNYTWHDFRHTFSHRILADDRMTLTDAQALMRHRHLDTLNNYAAARLDELVTALHRHLATPPPEPPKTSIRYDADDLAVLFPGLQL
jgi:integrase/recombinase XerC